MKSVKVMATVDHQGQLTLDHPLALNEHSRVEVIILVPESGVTDEPTQAQVLEDFSQAWDEAMTGQTIPVSQLWQELDHV